MRDRMKRFAMAWLVLSGCGDRRPYRLIVEEDTVFCRLGARNASFAETHAEKLRAWLRPGEHELPVTDANEGPPRSEPHPWGLPLSLEREAGVREDLTGDAGSVFVEMNEAAVDQRYRALFLATQPVVHPNGRSGTFALQQIEEAVNGRGFVIGPRSDPVDLAVALWWDEPPEAFMATCDFDGYFENRLRWRWRVEHELGSVELSWAGGFSQWTDFPPRVFTRAAGVHAGQEFEQDDYFKLVHAPDGPHGNWNNFAVLFDEPIEDACGVAFTHLGPDHPELSRSGSLVDCDLAEIRPIQILDATLEPE
jgi:hypothetical protein